MSNPELPSPAADGVVPNFDPLQLAEQAAAIDSPAQAVSEALATQLTEARPTPRTAAKLLRRRVGVALAGVAAAAALVGTLHNAPLQQEDKSPLSYTLVDHPVPSSDTKVCPVVPQSAIDETKQLLAAPLSPNFQREAAIPRGTTWQTALYPWQVALHNEQIEDEYAAAVQQDTAREFGLHVFDNSQLLYNLRRAQDTRDYQFAPLLAQVQAYMSQFGVEVRLATANDKLQDGIIPGDMSKLNTPYAVHNLEEMIQDFGLMPYEYVQMNGVKRILIGLERDQTADGAYATGGDIVANFSIYFQPGTFGHEDYHHAAAAQCGNMNAAANDPGYEAYVPLGDESWPNVQDEWSNSKILDLRGQIERLIGDGRYVDACRVEDELASMLGETAFPSKYGETDTLEDEAEMGKIISEPKMYYKELQPETPLAAAKLEYLIARLLAERPELARYFIEISDTRLYAENPCDETGKQLTLPLSLYLQAQENDQVQAGK